MLVVFHVRKTTPEWYCRRLGSRPDVRFIGIDMIGIWVEKDRLERK